MGKTFAGNRYRLHRILPNTDRLQQGKQDCIRGCTWQLKKVKTIYRLVFDRGDSFNQMNPNYRLCTSKYHEIATTVALNLNTTLHQNIIPICQQHKALIGGICCHLVLNDLW